MPSVKTAPFLQWSCFDGLSLGLFGQSIQQGFEEPEAFIYTTYASSRALTSRLKNLKEDYDWGISSTRTSVGSYTGAGNSGYATGK